MESLEVLESNNLSYSIDAEQASFRIEELKKQGIEYNKYIKEEECKREVNLFPKHF